MFNINAFTLGIIIFLARICDVSLGTIRTIVIVQGRSVIAFFTGFLEILIWITVISAVVTSIRESPILVFFYAAGFATGNVVGIAVERKLAFGLIILKVFTKNHGDKLADEIRNLGQPVTIFKGEGMHGPVSELYIVCKRRNLKQLLYVIKKEDPNAFYITEQAREVSKVLKPVYQPVTGWRAILKKK